MEILNVIKCRKYGSVENKSVISRAGMVREKKRGIKGEHLTYFSPRVMTVELVEENESKDLMHLIAVFK